MLTKKKKKKEKKRKKEILSPEFSSLEKPQWPDFQGFISFSLFLYSNHQMSNAKHLGTK